MQQLSLPLNIPSTIPLLNDPLWSTFRQYIKNYPGKHNRFEVMPTIPRALLAAALKLQVPCAHCGKKIYPIRRRHGTPGRDTKNTTEQYFLALTCPLADNFACARGKAAREASRMLAEALNR